MNWRIRVMPDAMADGIAIQIARQAGTAGHAEQVVFTRESQIVDVQVEVPRPSLTIDDDLGRALLDALAAHYGATTGGQQQRADFEHERGRVDRLIAHLTRPLAADA